MSVVVHSHDLRRLRQKKDNEGCGQGGLKRYGDEGRLSKRSEGRRCEIVEADR